MSVKKHIDASTGIAGLDDILSGGLERRRTYLLEGDPGTGKTTVALQFLIAGAAAGEKTLYITLAETAEETRAAAASHAWDLSGIEIFELVPPENLLDDNQQQSLLYSSDLELGETTKRIFDAFEKFAPTRIVLDSLSEIRLLAQNSLRYRRQILSLKHFFARKDATVVLLDDLTSDQSDKTVHSVAHGVFRLEEEAAEYGPARRRIRILKYRGRRYRSGYHDFAIITGGLQVFPRLIAAGHKSEFKRTLVKTMSPELDSLLGGGVDRGTSVLLLGPAGCGKSTLALTFIESAFERREKSAMFVFDEELALLFERANGIGVDLPEMVQSGLLCIEQIDAAECTPGEFSARVRNAANEGAKTVVIDSLNGYQAAMPGERALILHVHELLQYLNRQGTTTILTVAQHGLVGEMKAPVDVTYIADTVILLRFFEAFGRVRRAISVMKKRSGKHEDTIREYRIDERGFTLGAPLTTFQGVLRGVPTMSGPESALMKVHDA